MAKMKPAATLHPSTDAALPSPPSTPARGAPGGAVPGVGARCWAGLTQGTCRTLLQLFPGFSKGGHTP